MLWGWCKSNFWLIWDSWCCEKFVVINITQVASYTNTRVTTLIVTIGLQEAMSYITPVGSSNRCNIGPVLIGEWSQWHWTLEQQTKEASVTAQERRLWFVFRLLYCLVCAFRYFFLSPSDEAAASFSLSFETFMLPYLHSNAKPLHSYKIALSVTSLP